MSRNPAWMMRSPIETKQILKKSTSMDRLQTETELLDITT